MVLENVRPHKKYGRLENTAPVEVAAALQLGFDAPCLLRLNADPHIRPAVWDDDASIYTDRISAAQIQLSPGINVACVEPQCREILQDRNGNDDVFVCGRIQLRLHGVTSQNQRGKHKGAAKSR